MKTRLPTLGGKPLAGVRSAGQREQQRSRAIAQDWAARANPTERPPVARRVLAIAHDDQAAIAAQLARDLCVALVKEGASVAALVTVDTPALASEAEQAWAGLMDAGARQAKLLRRPDRDPEGALQAAVTALGAEADWVVALGNVLPQLLQPTFTVVVTGHRRELAGTGSLVMQAQLEVTTPTPELATLLARNLVQNA